MGITAIVSGALVDLYSRGLPQQDFLPMIIMSLVLMSLDLTVVARMDIPQNKKEKLKMGDVGSALVHPQVLLFLVGRGERRRGGGGGGGGTDREGWE